MDLETYTYEEEQIKLAKMQHFQHRELEEMPLDIKDKVFCLNHDDSKSWLNTVWDLFPIHKAIT